MVKNIAWLKELNKDSLGVAGGKGASLGEMYNNKFPVPASFVVTAQAYKEFLQATQLDTKINLILKNLNVDNTKELSDVSKKIKEMIVKERMAGTLKKEILEAYNILDVDEETLKAGKNVLELIKNGRDSAFVAVRSSATFEDMPGASFAGQMETYLNVKGGNKLIESVKKCWASLFTPRAIFYREKNNFPHEKVLIAVIVQRMVNSDKCVHPNTLIQTASGEILQIKDLVENQSHSNLISADLRNLNVETSKCLRYAKIESPKWMYDIKSKVNEIITTEAHRFFVLDNLEIMEKPVSELNKGDRIAVAKKVYISGKPFIIPRDLLKFDYYFISEKGRKLLHQRRREFSSLKEVSNICGINFSTISNIEKGVCRCSEKHLKIFCNLYNLNFDEFLKKYAKPSIQKTHISSLKIPKFSNNGFCQILGYVIGDAYIRGKSSLVLTDKDIKNLEFYQKLIKEVFNLDSFIKKDSGRLRLLVGSRALAIFLKEFCPEILVRSPQRKIPNFVQTLPQEQVAAFLRGLFDAEGCVDKKEVTITMSSEVIIDIIKLFFLRFEIICHKRKIYGSGMNEKGIYYRLDITAQDSIINYHKDINFSSPKKKEVLTSLVKEINNRKSHTNIDIIPIKKDLLRKVIANLGIKKELRIYQPSLYHVRLTRNVFTKIVELLEKRVKEIKKVNICKENILKNREVLKIPRKKLISELNCSEKLLEKVEKNEIKNSRIKKEYIVEILQKLKKKTLNKTEPIIERFRKILNSDILWDRIENITKIKTDVPYFYDLTINPHSNYLANGFITHNSGVIFSVNPSTNNKDEIIIEAGFGLGEAVVSGAINPDLYILDKNTLEIKEKKLKKQKFKMIRDENTGENVNKKILPEEQSRQVLTEEEIKQLGELAKRLEDHYSKAQDIEFAVEKNRVYIVQSRPVTTLKKGEVKKEEIKGEELVSGLAASPGIASGIVKIVKSEDDIHNFPEKGYILVTEMTNPSMVPIMKKAVAIVTDEGGMTSHASIVSRELGIPCIVGTEEATMKLEEGLIITVDAVNGKVYKGEIKKYSEKIKTEIIDKAEGIVTKTKIYMNLGEPSKIDVYKEINFDGIGLMRLEFIIAGEIGEHPNSLIKNNEQEKYINELVKGIEKIAKNVNNKPVIVRFSDFKTNEYHDLKGGEEYEEKEDNPMLGWRGVSRYISDEFKEAFRLECRAIKKVREECKNVHVMLPFVRNIEEVEKVLSIMKEENLERSEEFQVWLMAEVPSMVFLADEFSKLDVDGCSIGSNDLTQLVLGVDRDNERLGKMGYFDEKNEAVFRAIKMLIEGFHRNGKKVGICGQSPSVYPQVVNFLVENKIDSISLNPDAVGKVKRQVSEIERNVTISE